MLSLFILFILGLVGLAIVVVLPGVQKAFALIPFVLALILGVFSCTTIVQAKEVGVLTTFGKPSDRTLEPGLHIKAPWQKVTEVDGTIQTDKYVGDKCIYVRIGDGSRACLTLTHRWQIVPERANETYANFRSNDPTESLREAVVSTQLVSVAQDVMSKYNPIAGLSTVAAEDAGANLNFAPDYDQIAADITAGMDARYGPEPLVRTVAITVSYLSLSDTTQAKINAFIAEVANTRIAVQKEQTAAAEAKANQALEASVTNAPNVLVSKCLDLLAEASKTHYALPAGFSCWPGSNGVVIPGGK
jgi:regulator of protease activity HflC (stomatin/prohibitin superfamily)